MDSPKNIPAEEEPKKRSDEYWTGMAFLPIGITFLILGLTNPTYLAVGLPFLIIGITMMAHKNEDDGDDQEPEEDMPAPDADSQNFRRNPPA